MAQKDESPQVTEETSERVERISLAMANGEAITEEDMLWIADFNEKQAIIQTALTEGRRIEEKPIHFDDGRTVIQWTEFLPMPGGEVLMRRGTDMIKDGMFGVEVTRTASYYNPNDPMRVGMIESVLSGGKEEVTRITGDIFGDLKIGDTRPSPIPSSGLAGVRPSSWDPGSNQFGFASGGNNKPSTDTTTSGSTASEPTGAGLGSPGMQGTDGVELSGVGQVLEADTGPGEQGGGDDGSEPAPGDSVDPDPGTEEQGGSDEGDPMPEESSDPEAGSFGDAAGGGGDEAATPKGEVTAGEGQIEVGTFYTKGEGSDSYDYPSGATVEIPHDSSSDSEYHASDDYYSAGSADIPRTGSGQDATVEKAGDGGGGGGYSMSWEQWQAHMAANWTDPNWNPEGAPIDYGDAADPNYDPVAPDPGTPQDDPGTQILVDPSWYEESPTGPSTELEMVGVLENTGNPLEENQAVAPGGGMPNTSEQELVAGDAMAMAGTDMAMTGAAHGSVAEGPELGSVGAEEPEHGGSAPSLEDDGPLP